MGFKTNSSSNVLSVEKSPMLYSNLANSQTKARANPRAKVLMQASAAAIQQQPKVSTSEPFDSFDENYIDKKFKGVLSKESIDRMWKFSATSIFLNWILTNHMVGIFNPASGTMLSKIL